MEDGNGTVIKLLIVEVIDARNLVPIDGHGASSPYVVVDYYGQRKRTGTVVRDLNPTWNEVLKFNMGGGASDDVFGDTIEAEVYHDKSHGPTRRSNSLGRVHLSASQYSAVRKGEEALMYYKLERKSFISWISSGEIGLKIYRLDEEIAPPPAPPSPPKEADIKTTAEPLITSPPSTCPTPEPPPPPPPDPTCVDTAPSPIQSAPLTPSRQMSQPPTHPRQMSQPPTPRASTPPRRMCQPPTPRASTPPTPSSPAMLRSQSATTVSVPEVRRMLHPPPPMPPPLKRNLSVESIASSTMERPSAFDLVDKMHYLFVRVVKARSIPSRGSPVVKIVVSGSGARAVSSPARRQLASSTAASGGGGGGSGFLFEWDQTFAFGRKESTESSTSILEISVWDPMELDDVVVVDDASASASGSHDFLGGICFDVSEIPVRDPPDSALAPQWYRLDGGGNRGGDLMLATWVGTQADESFPDAWKTDGAVVGNASTSYSKAKVYLSPKLWYLRATILEAQADNIINNNVVKVGTGAGDDELGLGLGLGGVLMFHIRAQLGFQMLKTKPVMCRTNGSPSFNNEELVFVVAEPFMDEELCFSLEMINIGRPQQQAKTIGVARVPLTTIERRVDDRKVMARWLTLTNPSRRSGSGSGSGGGGEVQVQVHVRLCFDGGYHVMDEPAHVCSDYRPTAKQLWKPPIGTLEVGMIGCKNLVPMNINGKLGTTDAYAVAKYGPKWVRTRTMSDSLDPRWNEQYTWRVYDPCTVLTVGVFNDGSSKDQIQIMEDSRMGKVRVRVSSLQSGKVYRNRYPLMLLMMTNSSGGGGSGSGSGTVGGGAPGLKKMGEIELALRFVRNSPTLDVLQVYTQPLLPLMHHLKPLGIGQQEMLRNAAAKILAAHLSRASEPPLRRETVMYLLDAESNSFSMRKVRANWMRIVNVIAGMIDLVRWIDDTRTWKNPTATILVHALLVMLVWFPDLILPTLAAYVFFVGAWNYRFIIRSRNFALPHLDAKMSLAETVDPEELDEEFDLQIPSSRPPEVVRSRYDKLRMFGSRMQTVLGDVATQGERIQSLLTWRDPTATAIFVALCFLVATLLYLLPPKMVAMASGFYFLRHPMFRDRAPSPVFNFFRRLPSLADRMF